MSCVLPKKNFSRTNLTAKLAVAKLVYSKVQIYIEQMSQIFLNNSWQTVLKPKKFICFFLYLSERNKVGQIDISNAICKKIKKEIDDFSKMKTQI